MYHYLQLNIFSILFIFFGMISLMCKHLKMNPFFGIHIKKTLQTQSNYAKGNLLAGYINISIGILLFMLNTVLYLLNFNSKKIVLLNFFLFLLCSLLVSFYVNNQLEKNKDCK